MRLKCYTFCPTLQHQLHEGRIGRISDPCIIKGFSLWKDRDIIVKHPLIWDSSACIFKLVSDIQYAAFRRRP